MINLCQRRYNGIKDFVFARRLMYLNVPSCFVTTWILSAEKPSRPFKLMVTRNKGFRYVCSRFWHSKIFIVRKIYRKLTYRHMNKWVFYYSNSNVQLAHIFRKIMECLLFYFNEIYLVHCIYCRWNSNNIRMNTTTLPQSCFYCRDSHT